MAAGIIFLYWFIFLKVIIFTRDLAAFEKILIFVAGTIASHGKDCGGCSLAYPFHSGKKKRVGYRFFVKECPQQTDGLFLVQNRFKASHEFNCLPVLSILFRT